MREKHYYNILLIYKYIIINYNLNIETNIVIL